MNGTILVCLDKFRGCLTATQACAHVVDGGEGTEGSVRLTAERLREIGVVATRSLLQTIGRELVADPTMQIREYR